MTDHDSVMFAAVSPPRDAGSIVGAFNLCPRGPFVKLRVDRRIASAMPGLLPEIELAEPATPADAALVTRARSRPAERGRLPVLQACPTVLRTPPVRGRAEIPFSLTLARYSSGGRMTSWAERILAQQDWFTEGVARRARDIVCTLLDARLGGTWWGAAPRFSAAGHAVVFASRDDWATRRMLATAVTEQGAAHTILVAARPGRLASTCARLGVSILTGTVDPWPLIEEAASIHAEGDAETAILARLLGAKLHCYGPGPAVTTGDPLRLTAATFLLGSRYADPFTGKPISCEAFIERAIEWRNHAAGTADIACFVGISFWKRRRIAEMLGSHRRPVFRRTAVAAVYVAIKRGGSVAVWGSRVPPGLDRRAQMAGVPVSQIEDGFIRSAGLGADFFPPLSIVVDRLGLFYDSARPSDLEVILSDSRFAPALLARAARLRRRIVQDGVTKYNLPSCSQPSFASGRRRILLVPGQVADDRSVLLGGNGARPGLELLAHIRRRAPDAFIVYKPHPDVDAGHRRGIVPDAECLQFADQIVRGGSMATLLDVVDEIHTLTSLTGFEALLRGKPVTTYGQPFYAGWGLTTDINPVARRTRRLCLDELVAGVLLLYARYLDPFTGLPCGPETVLDRLAEAGTPRTSPLVLARRLQGRLLHRWNALTHRTLQKGALR